MIRAFDQPGRLLLVIDSSLIVFQVDNDLISILDPSDAVPPLIPNQLRSPLNEHALLPLLLHLLHLLACLGNFSTPLAGHLD